MTPTAEQEECVRLAATGDDVRIIAYAGAGKSSTLKLLAERQRKRGIYLAFNKAIAEEASRKFPPWINCQPPGTKVLVPVKTGRVKSSYVMGTREVPIESLRDGDKVVTWDQRYGAIRKKGRRIQVGSRFYDGELITVQADTGESSTYTDSHHCLAWVRDAFEGKWVLYMMRRRGYFRIGIAKWRGETARRNGFAVRIIQQDADAAWILSAHDSRPDAVLAEALAHHRHGVPGWCFISSPGGLELAEPWASIEPNGDRAATCLLRYGRDIAHPFWQRGESLFIGGRVRVLRACNLMDGMRVATAENQSRDARRNRLGTKDQWPRIVVTRRPYRGMVYSLDVEHDHTYVADGIVTHNCRTAHSLAFGEVGRFYRHKLNGRLTLSTVVQELGLGGRFGWTAIQLARAVVGAVRQFEYSADATLEALHIPHEHLVSFRDQQPDLFSGRADGGESAFVEYIVRSARELWRLLTDPKSAVPISHDTYLKVWQLRGPRIFADVIYFDEAQDASPVMAAIVAGQAGAQRVFVGDPFQAIYCQPEGTRVRVVTSRHNARRSRPTTTEERPIEQIRVGDLVVAMDIAKGHLHRQGRPVTEVNRRPYAGFLVRVRTGDSTSSYTPDHHVVTLVGDALDGKHVVYLMRRGRQFRVGRCPWFYRGKDRARQSVGPYFRAKCEGADAFWVLAAYDTAAEASLGEAMVAWWFSIPGMVFKAQSGKHIVDVDGFWRRVGDNTENAARCLDMFGRSIDAPLWDAAARKNLLLRRPLVTRASNLMDGMRVLVVGDSATRHGKRLGKRFWSPITIQRAWYDGVVVSLSVAGDHTYVADGILTHNSWRGAVNAMAGIEARTGFLTQSFRWGTSVANVANAILAARGDLPKPVRGDRSQTTHIMTDEDAVLAGQRTVICRGNAKLLVLALEAADQKRNLHVVGSLKPAIRLLESAYALWSRDPGGVRAPELLPFKTWEELQMAAMDDNGLEQLVRLVDQYTARIPGMCKRLDESGEVPEERADIILTTAHKAKGREWEQVEIASDYTSHATKLKKGEEIVAEEVNILYVAATRARRVLKLNHAARDLVTMGPERIKYLREHGGEDERVNRWREGK